MRPKSENRCRRRWVIYMISIGIACLSVTSPAVAIDAVAVELGVDGYDHEMLLGRLALWWNIPKLSTAFSGLQLITSAELMAGYWSNSERLLDLGATPVLRIQPVRHGRIATPYLEGAVGFHYVSGIVAAGRNISTNFQFGDHLAVGLLLGSGGRLDIAYKFQHLSNASIRQPNAGINFHILRLAYRFQ